MGNGCVVSIREETGKNTDIRIESPCDSKSRVINVGSSPASGMYVLTGDIGGGSCGVFGAAGSGNGYVVSSMMTKDTGTPYSVTTIRTLG